MSQRIKGLGNCWVDWGEAAELKINPVVTPDTDKMVLGIECDNPPNGKHFLLFMVVEKDDNEKAWDLAERICYLLEQDQGL